MSSWIYTADHSEYHMGGYEQQDNRFDINTIAKALSCINRFCGHTSRPYSVAEHSLLVCDILRDQGYSCLVQMAGLLHDAHEAYIGDVSSPVKWELGIAWDSFEHRHMMALRKHFALITTYAAYRREIKQADLVALATERRDLLDYTPGIDRPWAILDTPGHEVGACCRSLVLPNNKSIPPKFHERDFLNRYLDLQHEFDRFAAAAGTTQPPSPTTTEAHA